MYRTSLARNTWYMSDDCAAVWRRAEHLAQRLLVRKGTAIYRQGEHVHQVYFVLDGEVELSALFPDGETAIFDLLGRNGLFGEGPALTGEPCHGTATATQDSALLSFNIRQLQVALPHHPELAWVFLRVLAMRHYTCAQRLLHVFRGEPWIRVGELLNRLMQLHGQPIAMPARGMLLAISLTHAEIARMTGLSRVSVTRVLKQMRTQKVIAVIERRIIVLAPNRLLFDQ